MTKLDRLARSVGDLLEIVARLEAKKVSLRVLAMSAASRSTRHRHRQVDVGRHRRRGTGRTGSHAGAAARDRPSQREKAATRAVCRPFGDRLPRSSGSKSQASGPSEIAVQLGIGRASVYRVLGTSCGAGC